MKLYEYQQNTINALRTKISLGFKRIILQAATGAGKTVMFTYIAKNAINKGNTILILTDRRELRNQSKKTLQYISLEPTLLTADTKTLPDNRTLVIADVETLKRRLSKDTYKEFLHSFTIVIIDEAHKRTFDKVINNTTENQIIIGATATPEKLGLYSTIVCAPQINELISLGKLSKPEYYGIKVDLSKVNVVRGEFDVNDMSIAYDKDNIYQSVVDNYIKLTPDKKCIIFCSHIKNSLRLQKEFLKHNIESAHIDSYNDENREKHLADFTSGKLKVLLNVGIATTGLDVPDIEVVILYRATKSLTLYMQMVGRASRITETKNSFIVMDYGQNTERFGFWHDDRVWPLPEKKKGESEAPMKICPVCARIMYASVMKCVCGFVFPPTKKNELLGKIELVKVDTSIPKHIKKLEERRVKKGYKVGWVLYKLKTLDDFKSYGLLKGYKEYWAKYAFERYSDKDYAELMKDIE